MKTIIGPHYYCQIKIRSKKILIFGEIHEKIEEFSCDPKNADEALDIFLKTFKRNNKSAYLNYFKEKSKCLWFHDWLLSLSHMNIDVFMEQIEEGSAIITDNFIGDVNKTSAMERTQYFFGICSPPERDVQFEDIRDKYSILKLNPEERVENKRLCAELFPASQA